MKKLLPLFIAAITFATTARAQNIQLYAENFNNNDAAFTLNSGGPGSSSGLNQWIINTEFDGQPTYPNTINEDSTVSGTITSSPFSTYLHINDFAEAQSNGIANANYNPASASDRFTFMADGFCTLGLTDVILSFFYICEGSPSAYGGLYYSIDGGAWTQYGQTTYNDQRRWKYVTFTDPAWANVANLRFGWRWQNDNGTNATPASFGIDDIIAVATYDDVNNPVTITMGQVFPNPICQENDLIMFFDFSTPLCYGSYQFEISDATGSFANPVNFGYSINLANQINSAVSLPLPENLVPGSCYKVRVIRTDPAPVIISDVSVCIDIQFCPNSINTQQPAVTLDTNAVCIGSVIDVPFSSFGVFNQFNSYVAQLSDSNGIFQTPPPFIGQLNSGETFDAFPPGSVSGLIPNVPSGCGYFIRVISNSPAATGTAWGPFCIQECDINTNQQTDVLACISQSVGFDTIISIDINEFNQGVTYGPGNEFQVELLDGMTFQQVNISGLGFVVSQTGTTVTITVPNSLLLGTLGLQPGMYYMRIVATESSDPENSLGTLVRLTIGAPNEFLGIQMIPSDPVACEDESVTYYPTPINFNSTYTWTGDFNGSPYEAIGINISFGNAINDWVMQVQENNFGCFGPVVTSDTLDVLPSNPSAVIVGPTNVCLGDTVEFNAIFNDNTFYSWTTDGGVLIDTSNNVLTMIWDSVGTFGIDLLVLNMCGSSDGTKNINVKPYPLVKAGNDTTVCKSESVTLNTVTGTYSYDWKDNFNNSIGNTAEVTVTPDTTTTYTITSTVTGGGGCASTDSMTVFVEVSPEDDYSDTICLGEEITLDAIIAGAQYIWSNGETTQTITTSDSGWYDVTIFVDTAICEYFKHFHVVGKTCSVELPNVFTPNGDGNNDSFTSFTPGAYDEFIVLIYNRWGREVFESSDPNFIWDGKTKGGAEAKAGTYFYVVQTTLSGVTEKKTGTVTLLR